MSESWQIALVSGLLSLMVAVLGVIASTLAGIRRDLGEMVRKHDCDRSMDAHCHRLDVLDAAVNRNAEEIAIIRGRLDKER